jgi:hypothetical protein
MLANGHLKPSHAQNITSLAAWLVLGFIVYATLSPLSTRPSMVATENSLSVVIERSGAYGLLGLLFGVVLIVLSSAIGLELLQHFIADRDA